MAFVFGLAIFASALLMFAVQPMIGRLVLPSLGGSPAVWNTVMVFFQASLLIGYALAHGLAKLRSVRAQAAAHATIILGALAVLPVGLPAWPPPTDATPVLWLLGALAAGVGLPALALATMSPLIQAWYARAGLKRSHDPYFLYAASNAGSLIGLLGYPLLLEPWLGLREQRLGWSIGLGALAFVLVPIWLRAAFASHDAAGRHGQRAGGTASAAAHAPEPRRGAWGWWIVLALVPSSLLLGVTQHLTTDIAAVPLLWAVPLALYLLTFIIAFGVRTDRVLQSTAVVAPVLTIALVVAMLVEARHPLHVVMALHLGAFFVIALGCHARLASLRPPAADLTRFYFFVSLGGVLGGAVNALIAPVLLDWVAEYPVMIALGGMLAVGLPRLGRSTVRRAWPGVAAAGVLVLALLAPVERGYAFDALLIGGSALACYLCSKRPAAFGVALLAVLLLPEVLAPDEDIVRRDRTFFGVHTVYRETFRPSLDETASRHVLRHGGTTHGLQNLGDNTPWTYYHPLGPLGEIMSNVHAGRGPISIGAIGLGVGSLAAYTEPGDRLTFFEIDPVVIEIAADPALFTFLDDSRGRVEHVVGDGRLTIAGRGPFDLIVLDAFTSDAIPVHLLTAEAFGVYAAELAEGGLIAMHVSNRHLELGPVIAATAARAGLTGAIITDQPEPEIEALGQAPSTWVVLAADEAALGRSFRGWEPLGTLPEARAWTDDYSNILGVLRLD